MAGYRDPWADIDRFAQQVFGQVKATAAMPMDLYRDGDHYVLKMDLPGVDHSSIDVSVEDRVLTIRAERAESVPTDAQWLTHERSSGSYARQLNLGQGLAVDKISADYTDGVLVLTIPVAEEAKPRKIEVTKSTSTPPLSVNR